MKTSFLDYYRENLTLIRELGAEFAEEFPKIAARLDLNEFECPDPYVERLLEGTAFLSARVEKKLDDGYPRLLESLLASVAPFTLCPEPSGTVAELRPEPENPGLKSALTVSSASLFQGRAGNIETPVSFSTLWETNVSAVHVADAEYMTRDIEQFPSVPEHAAAALKIRFSPGAAEKGIDLFLNMPEALASELQRQIMTETIGILVRTGTEPFKSVPDIKISNPALREKANGLFSDILPQMDGIRTCSMFFSHPDFFQFLTFKGLPLSPDSETEAVFFFRKRVPELRTAVRRTSFRTNCVPILNLFRKRSDRTQLAEKFEYHISPERTAQMDYEVFFVSSLEFFDANNRNILNAEPFYTTAHDQPKGKTRVFFSTHREARIFEPGKLRRSSYGGTEAFVSISGEDFRRKASELKSFTANLLCTNRDLPILLQPDTVLTPGNVQGIVSATFVKAPSGPGDPMIRRGRKDAWERTGHIAFNLSSALAAPDKITADILRGMLKLYSTRTEEETETMISGITKIHTKESVFRFVREGSVFFENGWEMLITLDEEHFAGNGFFIFAEVLQKFLHGFTPLNSFLAIDIESVQRGRIRHWMTTKQS